MNVYGQSSRILRSILWAASIVGVCAVAPAFAEDESSFDYNAFMNETQLQTSDPDRMTMVWWLPEEFWEWSLSQDKAFTKEGRDEFIDVLRPYVLLVVLDGTLGPLGGATFVEAAELRQSVVLVDMQGSKHKPLNKEAVSRDATNLAIMMKPIVANMAGAVGENMEFIFFPGTTSNGARIATATMKGSFSVEVGDQVFKWRTPLGSVLPPKTCPVDDEKMSGAWSYCPWHGKKLAAKDRKGS